MAVPRLDCWSIAVIATTVVVTVGGAQVPAIRPTDGLVMVSVTHEERGDYENVYSIGAVTPASYYFGISSNNATAPDTSKQKQLVLGRTVRLADDSTAHRLNIIFASDDPQVFPGSTIFLSKAMLAELKSGGKTSTVVGDAAPGAFQGFMTMLGAVRQYYRGDLTRVGPTTVSVIIDDTPTPLPAIESRGHFAVGGQTDDVDVVTFDNPAWPLTLKWSSQGRSYQLTEIQLPQTGVETNGGLKGRALAMNGALGGKGTSCGRAEVHGIYFAFASATLVPASDPALHQIATLMTNNPTWVVTIEGHTDSIGTKAANLDLSNRRAAAVRAALVTRFGVGAARLLAVGFGDTKPVTTNATIEGRARNRRVELARKC